VGDHGQQWHGSRELAAVLDLGVRRGRADAHGRRRDRYASQLLQLVDVDEDFGRSESKLHHRQQRMPTEHQLGLVAVLLESRKR